MDGHELSVVSTIFGLGLLVDRTLPTGWVRHMIHRHPMGAMSLFWGVAGITMPLIIPKIRRSLGFPTNQYDSEHPNVKYNKWIEELREIK